MIGARVEMLVQPCRYGIGSAIGDDRVDEAVAARLGDVVVGEAQPLPVVQVVRRFR